MKKLFEPHKIGKLELKNRVSVPPMVYYHQAGEDGYVVDGNVEHYRALARGGFGLIIQEAACVSREGKLNKCQLGIWEDGQIEGLKRITSAVHEEGCPIFIQIHHAGIMGTEKPLVCSSDYAFQRPDGNYAEARALTLEEVQAVREQFIQAGRRAFEAGYDGVEIHGCHSYLLSQFLSSGVNKRTDSYGEDRTLLVREILAGIRQVTSDQFVIGIRLGGFEPELSDGVAHAKVLEKAGMDFLDISYGFAHCHKPFAPEDFPYKDIIYAAKEIKSAVKIPVFAVNGINSREMAEGVLEAADVDMVQIGRGSLVNYNWANDAREGSDTGRCLNCKVCMWRVDAAKCPGRILHRKNCESAGGGDGK